MPTETKSPVNLYTFTVISGEHQGNKRVYKQGQMFQSQYPLDELFPGKFQRMPNSPAPVDDAAPAPKQSARKASSPPVVVEFNFDDAVNVTHMFPTAKEAGLAVYKDSVGSYAVAEAESKTPANLAEQVLSSKKQVDQFLTAFKPTDVAD